MKAVHLLHCDLQKKHSINLTNYIRIKTVYTYTAAPADL